MVRKVLKSAMAVLLTVVLMGSTSNAAWKSEISSGSSETSYGNVITTGLFEHVNYGDIVYYPEEMLTNNDVYPVVVWANGTMCPPAMYQGLLKNIAANGFIVITNTNMMSADGSAQIMTLDNLLAKNEDASSVFYHRVDTKHIAAAGHSQGGRSSVNAAAADDRFTCILSLAGSSNKEEASKLRTPAFFITGTADMIVMSSMWCKPSYEACQGPAVYASLKGAIHTTCCTDPDKYTYYSVKWLNAWLREDSSAMKVFAKNGELATDSKWKDVAVK